tara:strand:+ start:2876 stop:6646 length:3771 start_codon:yes stop_codon:yes gene_type:complete
MGTLYFCEDNEIISSYICIGLFEDNKLKKAIKNNTITDLKEILKSNNFPVGTQLGKSRKINLAEFTISNIDTFLELKKKICTFILDGNTNPSNVYVWFSMETSPFKTKEFSINGDEEHIDKYLNKNKDVYFTTRDILDNDALYSGNVPYNTDIVKEHTLTINKLLKNSALANKQIHYTNTKKGFACTLMSSDVVPNKLREWLNIEKIFEIFPLSSKVPFMIYDDNNETKRKIYRKFSDVVQLRKWSKLYDDSKKKHQAKQDWAKKNNKELKTFRKKSISQGIHGLSLKILYKKQYLTVKIYKKGGVNVFFRTSHGGDYLYEEDWNNIINDIQTRIIDVVNKFKISTNVFMGKKISPISDSNIKIRTMTTVADLNYNNMKESGKSSLDWKDYLDSLIPFYYVNKKSGKSVNFIRVKNYLNSDNLNFVLNQNIPVNRDDWDEEDILNRITTLYMTTKENASKKIDNLDRKLLNSNETKGPIIDIANGTSDRETRITLTGVKSWFEAKYAYDIVLHTFWSYFNSTDSKKGNTIENIDDLNKFITEQNIKSKKTTDWETESNNWDNESQENDWDNESNVWDSDDENDGDGDDAADNDVEEIKEDETKTEENNIQIKKLGTLKKWSLNNSYRLDRLKVMDPELFNYKYTENDKSVGFSNRCQPPTLAHPIVVTNEEKKRIDKSRYNYTDSLFYRNNWYIACEYFCWNCMIPLSEDDLIKKSYVKEGQCPECQGKIITPEIIKKKNASPEEYTIFKNKDKKEYRAYIGQKLKHPDNLLPPCRYKSKKKDKDNDKDKDKDVSIVEESKKKNTKSKKIPKSSKAYVKKELVFPLEDKAFGSFDESLHRLLDNPKNIFSNSVNSGNIVPNMSCYVREGISINTNKSFLNVICKFYDKSDTIEELFNVIASNLSKAEVILSIHGGKLIKMFEKENYNLDEFKDWKKKQSIEGFEDKYLKRIFTASVTLIKMIKDPEIEISHSFFWGILCHPGVIFKRGLNMYIFEKLDKGVNYVCPSNGDDNHYYYNDAKHVFVYCSKISGRKHYEPIIKVNTNHLGNIIYPHEYSFKTKDIITSIIPLRKSCVVVQNTNYIKKLSEDGYFNRPVNIDTIISYCKTNRISIKGQCLNKDLETVYILLDNNIFIPVLAGNILPDYKIIYAESFDELPKLNVTLAYLSKLDTLLRCKPISYTKDKVTNKVNGLVLQSNRVIPIKPTSKIPDLKYDERPFYFKKKTNETNKHTINKEFWKKYNQFCYELGHEMSKIKNN